MEKNWRLSKLCLRLPTTYFYGNEGDYSRYRILKELSDIFDGKDLLLNRYLRDKVIIVIYPRCFGHSIIAVTNDGIKTLDKIEQLKEIECDMLLIPGNGGMTAKTYTFPVGKFEEKLDNAHEVIFVESFPFGKTEFSDCVLGFIRTQGISCYKHVVLFDEGRKYGATDISDKKTGFESAARELRNHVDEVNFSTDHNSSYTGIDLRKAYYKKKRILLQDTMRNFSVNYEREFEYLKQSWLCDEDRKGILSGYCFNSVSDYENVRESDNVEKKMLDNLIDYAYDQKKEICYMIMSLLNTYLCDFDRISADEGDEFFGKLVNEIRTTYIYGKEEKCPSNKLDFRLLCNEEQYHIKLKRCVSEIIDDYLKSAIRKRIIKTMDECEDEYNEILKV